MPGRASRRGSAWPDVDGVKAPKLAREIVLAADQKQLVWIRILRAEPVLAGQDAPPQRDPPDGDRAPLPQRRKLLVGPSVVLPNSGVSPEEVLRELSRPEGIDA